MAEYRNYYDVLGVSRSASDKEIKQAYRKLARQYHPDMNPDDKVAARKFREINEAYEVLKDEDKRQQYDRLGSQYQQWQQMGGQGNVPWEDLMRQAGFAGGGPGGGPNIRYEYGSPGGATGGGGMFSDFFDMLFGFGGGGVGTQTRTRTRPVQTKAPIQGRHLEHAITISLEEAYHGSTRVIERGGKRLNVSVPPGVRSGQRIRLSGQGEGGYAGGPAGDLYLIVQVRDHPQYKREGDNLHRDVWIDLYTAVLGGEVSVPTLAGEVRLRVPPGTQTGQRFRLSGKGMPRMGKKDDYGDLYVRAMIRVPEQLTDEERQLFERLQGMR